MDKILWEVYNDSPSWLPQPRLRYFLMRISKDTGRRIEEFTDKNGRLRTWKERHRAEKKARELNALIAK